MKTTITEQDTLETLLTQMNEQQSTEFGHKRKHTTNAVELAESILKRDRVNITEGVYMGCPLTAADHRARAATHQAKADELKAGEKKDAHAAAAKAHNDAADAIEKANKSTAAAELFD
jgi:hypothetical protein